MVRIDGSIVHASVHKVDRLPRGSAPTAAQAGGSRPIDEPQLAVALRVRLGLAARLPLPAAVVIVGGICAAVGRSPVLIAVGWFGVINGVAIVAPAIYRLLRVRRAARLLDRADRWTPLPGRILTVGRDLRRVSAEVWLPDGARVAIRLKHLDVVANIKAGDTIYVAGEPVAGATVAVGVPGFAFVARVRLGVPTGQVSAGPRRDQLHA
jgi:hypothetical protein